MRQLRRANQPGGAVYRRGQLIRPRKMEQGWDPANPLSRYYDDAVMAHLQIDHATTGAGGAFAGIVNPGSAGAAMDGVGSGQTIQQGIWLDVTTRGLGFFSAFDLANKRILFPIWWVTGTTRPLRMGGAGTSTDYTQIVLNYSGNGLLAGANFGDEVSSVLTTPRVTSPVQGGATLVEFECQPNPANLMARYWANGLGSSIQSAFAAFGIDRVGGSPATPGMGGWIGDVVVLDRTSPDFSAAVATAQEQLSGKYGIAYPAALVQPRFGPHVDGLVP